MDKLERAVKLSEDTYCGVSAMLRPTVPITSEIVVENPQG
jgi:putative redox protein